MEGKILRQKGSKEHGYFQQREGPGCKHRGKEVGECNQLCIAALQTELE